MDWLNLYNFERGTTVVLRQTVDGQVALQVGYYKEWNGCFSIL